MMPFMPVSTLGYSLKNVGRDLSVELDRRLNRHFGQSDPSGKTSLNLDCGTGTILHKSDIKYEDAPGMRDLIKQHNVSSDGRHQIVEKDFEKVLCDIVCATQQLLSLKHYVSVFNKPTLGSYSASVGGLSNDDLGGNAFVNFVGGNGISSQTAAYQVQQFASL